VLISVPLGVLSAVRRHSWLDRIGTGYVLVGASIPPVWLALMLSFFVGYKLGWAPISGYCDVINPATECGGPGDWAYHLLLPWLVLGGLGGALYVRMIRANVLETMNEDWVRTARAKGAPERRVLRRHVLRCSLLPFVTILGLDLGTALGGAVFVESVFGLPGLGQLALTSVNRFDLPVIQGIVVFVTLAILLCNLLVDLLYAALDPRIELEPSPAR
jgi:peptide/nickel transport system permease protein